MTRVAIMILAFAHVAGCTEPKRIAEHLPTPPERLVCERAGTRPVLPAEHEIDWAQVQSVAAAKLEHVKFVTTLRSREGLVAGYVLKLEGKLFQCFTNTEWRRQFEKGILGQ